MLAGRKHRLRLEKPVGFLLLFLIFLVGLLSGRVKGEVGGNSIVCSIVEINFAVDEADIIQQGTSDDVSYSQPEDHVWACQPVLDNEITGRIYEIRPALPALIQAQARQYARLGRFYFSRVDNGRFEGDQLILGSIAVLSSESQQDIQQSLDFQNGQRRQLLKVSGVKRVSIIRISSQDAPLTSTSATEVYNNAFVNEHSAKQQMHRCSEGKVQIEPYQQGVYDVNLSTNTRGLRSFAVINQADDYLRQNHRDVIQNTDYVMYQLPPGTSGGWIAFAYQFMSAYNDDWILSLSAKMHEWGHNMQLRHAFEDGRAYQATNGYMGASARDSDGPLRCYNAWEYYFLGWHDDRLKVVVGGESRLLEIAAFVDYDETLPNEYTIVKANEYFLQYNRATKHNVATGEKHDLLTIITKDDEGTHLEAALNVGEEFRRNDFHVRVCNRMRRDNLVDLMQVSVGWYGNEDLCVRTPAPSPFPTQSPTLFPTPEPTPAPSASPTSAPSKPPTPIPTEIPTRSPTKAPVFVPSEMPPSTTEEFVPTTAASPAPVNSVSGDSPSGGELALSPTVRAFDGAQQEIEPIASSSNKGGLIMAVIGVVAGMGIILLIIYLIYDCQLLCWSPNLRSKLWEEYSTDDSSAMDIGDRGDNYRQDRLFMVQQMIKATENHSSSSHPRSSQRPSVPFLQRMKHAVTNPHRKSSNRHAAFPRRGIEDPPILGGFVNPDQDDEVIWMVDDHHHAAPRLAFAPMMPQDDDEGEDGPPHDCLLWMS